MLKLPPPPYFLILAFSHSPNSLKSNFLILLSDSHHSCGTLSKIKPAEATLLCFPASVLPEGEREKRERWHKSEKRCKNLPYFSPFSASAKGGTLSQCFSMAFFFLFNVSAPPLFLWDTINHQNSVLGLGSSVWPLAPLPSEQLVKFGER